MLVNNADAEDWACLDNDGNIHKYKSMDITNVPYENPVLIDRATYDIIDKYYTIENGKIREMTQQEKDALDLKEQQEAQAQQEAQDLADAREYKRKYELFWSESETRDWMFSWMIRDYCFPQTDIVNKLHELGIIDKDDWQQELYQKYNITPSPTP